ncbi:MAG: TonB-dependent receptor [Pseudomonadota bacterium]
MANHINRLMLASAIGTALFGTSAALAQEDTIEEVVVTGIRGSLKQSLDVKRDASQIVDAVSSEDVGKFPDTNVAESLQRITGVAIDRAGGEGQFITVRGLGPEFNSVLLNGRTMATDNPGREFSFDVLASDIIQRAEVYKTSSSDLQSGGIGATVNIVTARPFDRPGTHLSLSAAGIYDDLADETSPDVTGVASWTNEDTSLGFLFGVSYSDRSSQRDNTFTNGYSLRDGATIVNAPESASGLDASALVPLPAGRVQQQVVFSRDVQERERLTVNGAFQAAIGDNATLTVDGLYTDFDIQSLDTQFSGFFSPPFINPVVDANGTVVSFSRPSVDFANRNPLIAPQVGLSQNDNVITSNNRVADSYLFGANLEWDVTDSLTLDFDLSRSEASREGTNPFVVIGALAPESPLIELPSNAEISTITNLVGLTDPSIQRLHFVNINQTEIDDEITEAKFNGNWAVERGPLYNVSFGASFSDRTKQQQVFDNFAPTAGFDIFCAYCGYNVAPDSSILTPFNFDGFLGDASGSGTIPSTILGFSLNDAFSQLNNTANIMNPARRPDLSPEEFAANAAALIALRDAGDPRFGFYTPQLNPGAGFLVDEETTAVYINTEWEGDFGGELPWSANVGFRIARTQTRSIGVDQPVVQFLESPGDTQLDIVFGPSSLVSVDNDYTNFLPAANIKFETTDNTILRFAVSETVTRPTLTALGVNNTFGGRSNAPISGGGNPFLEAFESTNYDVSFEWYFDELGFVGLSAFHKDFENFIESQTLAVPREITFPAGNGGRTEDETVLVDFQDTRQRNGEEGSISGVELAFQKTFDGLPGIWSNVGVAANYTYVTSNIDRDPNGGAVDCDYNGLSPNSYNLSAFYEDNRWQARLAYNFREEFLFQCFAEFSEPRQREDYGQLDLSAAYLINDSVQVFLEAINLTDEDTRDFSRFENRFLTYEDTGTRFTIGVRASF